jgi:hypothetical protein
MNPQIIKCKGCGQLFKIYPHQVHADDPKYCPKCNKEADGPEWK